MNRQPREMSQLLKRQIDYQEERAVLLDAHRDVVDLLAKTHTYLIATNHFDLALCLMLAVINPLKEGVYIEAWLGISEMLEDYDNLPSTFKRAEFTISHLSRLCTEYDLP